VNKHDISFNLFINNLFFYFIIFFCWTFYRPLYWKGTQGPWREKTSDGLWGVWTWGYTKARIRCV